MQDTEAKGTPSLSCTPGRQVKLEEAFGTKENPETKEIQGDEGQPTEMKSSCFLLVLNTEGAGGDTSVIFYIIIIVLNCR